MQETNQGKVILKAMRNTSNTTHRSNLILSFKFWLVTVLLLLIYSTMLFAQYTNTVYLDPTNEGDPDQDGTIDHPFDSWDDVKYNLQSNTAYLQKRGTTEYRSGSVVTIDGGGLHDIKFGNYGTGERPVIVFNPGPNGFYFKRTTRMVVDGLELYGNYDNNGNFSGQAIYLSGHTSGTVNTTQITIQNCKIHRWGGGMALLDYSTKIDSITIDNCEIFHISEDGIFGNVDNFTCKNSHIYKVNRKFHTIGHSQQQSGGDGIQINGDNFLILNNIIDRSWTGNKFCFILGNAYSRLGLSGKILWNTFIPPKDTIDDDGGCCIYMAYTAKVDVGYNTFVGTGFAPDRAAASVGVFFVDTVNFYYNVLDSMNKVIITDQPPLSIPDKEINVNNNTILYTHIPQYPVFHASSDVIHARNNIFAIEPGIEPFLYYYGNMDTSNNIYVTTASQDYWHINPGFVDWENQNYRLRETSPAINTGMNYAGWLCDIDSVAVPQQSFRDKGTYEYSEGGMSNNPPNINNQGFDIEENTANGTIVGMIEASDPDEGQTLTFSIESGNTDNAFQINSVTGSLTVNNVDALNYEIYPIYNLVVSVQDNGNSPLSSQAIVDVNLININEIDQPATWLGNNSTDWNITSNWTTDLVPNENTIVYIYGGLDYYPSIKSGEINIGSSGNGVYNCRMISINNGGKMEAQQDNIININSEGSITINDGGELNIGNGLNIYNNGMLYIQGGIVNCTYDGQEKGNVIFYSGSGGYMDGGSITVFRSIQFYPGNNFSINEGTIYCGGVQNEVTIVQGGEYLELDNLEIKEGVSVQFISNIYTEPLIVNGDFEIGIGSNFINNYSQHIVVGGGFIMKSNEYGSASFVNYGSIDINGQIEVQNYLEADRWHYISSPVSNDTAGVFMDMFLYSFNESVYSPNNGNPIGWENIVEESIPLNVGEGYKVWSYSSMVGAENICFTKGVLNDGTINLPVVATDKDINNIIGDGEGWNLVGNPYPSGIDWNHQSWEKHNIDGSVYVFDGVQYLVWSGSGNFGSLTDGIIPSMQAFFVKANDIKPSLILSNESRVYGVSSYKDPIPNNLLELSIEGNGYSDKTYINFHLDGKIGYDSGFDAYKIKGISAAPQLYSFNNGNIMSINVLPELVSDTTISIGIEVGNNTEFVIQASKLESFDPDVEIYLEDKLQNHILNLRVQSIYKFTASPLDDTDRFLLHFGIPNYFEEDDMSLNDNIVIYANENKVYLRNILDNTINTRFFLYNISGSKIMEEWFWLDDLKCIPTVVNSGFYIVKLVSDEGIYRKKVFLN